MEVRFLASGEVLTTLDQNDFDGKTAREVKRTLAAHVGVSRFRQRLFAEDGYRKIQDDEVFGSGLMQFLQGPRNPNLRGGHGPRLVTD